MDVVTRSFAQELEMSGDGRTIVGRCVPYDIETTVADNGGPPYVEVWRHGAFRDVVRSPHRVTLNYEHGTSILDVCGHAVELVERDDGLYGTFRALGAPGDQALELIRSGAAGGLSVRARIHARGTRLAGAVTERVKVSVLEHVGLVGRAAYTQAGVLALRNGPDDTDGPAPAAITETLAYLATARAKYTPEPGSDTSASR